MPRKLAIGLVMLDIADTRLSAYDRDKISHPNTGAVILFQRNYENPEQLAALVSDIRSARNGEVLVAVDQEGGRVQRFREGFTRLPPAAAFAAHGVALARDAGWLMAAEVRAVDVDFSFAPVLDIDCGISTVIGDRSFAMDAQLCTELASAFRQGMGEAGMAAVGKHFPGHGAVAADSHLDLPVDGRTWEEIAEKDLLPFRRLIGEGLEGVMPAHVVYSAVDEVPAGFSRRWLQDILRIQLGFAGAIFSDDLSMAGAASAGGYAERAQMAQQAGCDMLLVCNNPAAAEQVLDALPQRDDAERSCRLRAMRGKLAPDFTQLRGHSEWLRIEHTLNSLQDSP